MKISIFGLGYVGCVSLGCLAKNGHQVIGVDQVRHKVDLINQGKPTIIENEIDEIIEEQHKIGNISATQDYKQAVLETDVSLVCVGTPSTYYGHLNLDAIFNVAKEISEALIEKKRFHVIAIRSTVLPGTNRKFGEIMEEVSGLKRGLDFAVISNPEFMREGSSVHDYYNPSMTVLGGEQTKGLEIMSEIYKEINAPIEIVGIEVAEIIKYLNNSFHALKIGFANEIGNICKKLNLDSHKVMELFCKDTVLNISPYYLKPGFAYGGSCLPKDLKALKTIAHDKYLSTPILSAIEESNNLQKQIAYEMILESGLRDVAILGLSFKAGTDDLRNSPIVEVTERLLGKGFNIRIYDEKVNYTKITGTNREYIDSHIPHLSELILHDLETVIKESEVVVINQQNTHFEKMLSKYPDKVKIDLIRLKNYQSLNGQYSGISW